MKIKYFKEPSLEFAQNQLAEDPRDGLVLYGPYEDLKPYSVKAGVIGTDDGLKLYKKFVDKINLPIYSTTNKYGNFKNTEVKRPSYPGFEAVFGIEWNSKPEISINIDTNEIKKIIEQEKIKEKRTHKIVDLYLNKIKSIIAGENENINIWFIIVPYLIYKNCRPNTKKYSKTTLDYIARTKGGQISIGFDGEEDFYQELDELLDTSSDFHHLMKAKLIQSKIHAPVQIIIESTLDFRDKLRKPYQENMKAHIAWTQTNTLYYKLGKLPWKLSGIRDGVCYLGIIFKKKRDKDVCSAAQMFLKDGDGTVFRGNIGLWFTEKEGYHLDKVESSKLLGMALDDYYFRNNAKYPTELFIHGRAKFKDDEWQGFKNAVDYRNANTRLIGVVIKSTNELKIFKDTPGEKNNYGVMRGTAVIINDKEAYLVTRGFVPRINSSKNLEIPNPLKIDVTHGACNIDTVLNDIMGLTKLNYNACEHSDGLPVTLRFSDKIGSILTSLEEWKTDMRAFKYYI